MSRYASELRKRDMPELVVPTEELGLQIWGVVFFVVNSGRCCGSIVITLEVEISDNRELPDNWELSSIMRGERYLIILVWSINPI